MNNTGPWPQVVYSVMVARWPEFVGLVLNESMAIIASNGQNRSPPPPCPMPMVGTVGRKEHHAALREASVLFLSELKKNDLEPGATEVIIPLLAGNDQIIVQNIPFSKRHFARNYNTQFSADTQAYYNQTYGYVEVNAELKEDALVLHLVPDAQ